MNYYVYVHTNKINGKKYVGITTLKPEYRWRNGKGYLSNNNGKWGQPKIARAIIKYGWDKFDHQYWEVYSKESMLFWEEFLIKKYDSINNGYNVTSGGEHYKHSEETKQKIGNANRNRKYTDERNNNLSKKLKGRRLSNNTKDKIAKANSRPILQFTLDNKFVKEWPSITDVHRSLGVSTGNVSSCAKGNRNKAYGYKWRYKN